MGSRGRSIRLRIYFLVAIPLLTMLGLFGYVTYTSVSNWLNLDRAPSLIQATSEPLTNFVNLLQGERRAAVVYLSRPSADNLNSFQKAVGVTKQGAEKLQVALDSPGTRNSSTPAEDLAIVAITKQINSMGTLRAAVEGKKVAPLDALEAYTNIIAGQGAVLQAEASSMTDAGPVLQGLALISAVNTQEDVSEQDAILASALASGSLPAPARVAFSNAAGRLQADTMTYQELFTPAELATYNTTLNKFAPSAVRNNLSTIQQAVPAGATLGQMKAQGLNSVVWQGMTSTWLTAASKAGTTTATTVLQGVAQPAIDAKRRVWILAIAGAAGLILTLLVSLLLSRSINRRLSTLRRSAMTLAEEQLPSVVARLRRGESVDVAAEAPPLRVGSDEIGQVGHAIDAVRQTAIRSAIDEARVRQGVNDMFRNLARRNQSLLQRQLTVLDEMERGVTDPDILENLFKMDHLTTRMRRHAEGLIILSGSPPGRSWSAPVKLIDVMRGAVAEVEDYARVTVSTQSRVAVSGSAVTDVIHLLAELIENATSLSPPFTQVRVSGEVVANGFAIEIEDRGLGMTPQRVYELNERLANPPDINPANTEQLGLFVVGQLARRHGIGVTLRPSPYGGTTVVALLPPTLIVAEGPAAITTGDPAQASGSYGNGSYGNGSYGNGSYGNSAYGNSAYGNGPYGGEPLGAGTNGSGPHAPGSPGTGTAAYGRGTGSYAAAADGSRPGGPASLSRSGGQRLRDTGEVRIPKTPAAGNRWPAAGNDGWSAAAPHTGATPASPPPTPYGTGPDQAWGGGYPSAGPAEPHDTGYADPGYSEPGYREPGYTEPAGPPIRISGALRHPGSGPGVSSAGSTGSFGSTGSTGSFGSGEVPVVTGVPVTRQTSPAPQGPPSFDVFTPIRRAEQDGAPSGGSHENAYPDYGAADDSYGSDSYGKPGAFGNSEPFGNNVAADESYLQGDPAGNGSGDVKGLPRRVRQASLAPQLRAPTAAAAGSPAPAAVPPATAASLTDMRNTLSAMQRGWQQGRSQTQRDTEAGADGE
jgi:signal transduction histidine kinase